MRLGKLDVVKKMAKSKRSKTQRHKAKQNWKTPKRQNACGPEMIDREDVEAIQKKRRRRATATFY